MPDRRVLYYALGGGHGHALRGLAVVSRLPDSTLVLPSRLAAWAEQCGVPHVAVREDGAAELAARLDPPDMLLVDVFPRGPTGELVPLLERSPCSWLIARGVRPAFYLHPPVREAIESRYQRVVWTEPPPPALDGLGVPAQQIPPVLLAPAPLPREVARAELGVADVPLVLALGSGPPERQFRLFRMLARLCQRKGATLRFVSHELPEVRPQMRRLFPAARWLPAADVVVAAGGYHAVHETLAAGVPAIFVPQARSHDDQGARVAARSVAASPEELEAKLDLAIDAAGRGGAGCAPARIDAAAGATRLADLIARRLGR